VLPAQLGRLHASLMLAQHPNDLILGKTASPHCSSPSDEQTYQWLDFRGAAHELPTIHQQCFWHTRNSADMAD
jgi:hypothetical protein